VDPPPIDYEQLTDGSAKLFGMENFGNTCYCNSILQCLYYAKPFRERILAFPGKSQKPRPRKSSVRGLTPHPFTVDPNAALTSAGISAPEIAALQSTMSSSQASTALQSTVSLPATSDTAKQPTLPGRRMSLFGRKDQPASGTQMTNGTASTPNLDGPY
jgi:ubiquitin carboxyl-terminal hydrolase 9/13